jgi:Putative Ig domain
VNFRSRASLGACALLLASLALGGCLDDGGDAAAAGQPLSAAAAQPSSIPTTGSQENRAPTLTGTPGTTIVAGSMYQFVPQAADADANTLTFSIQNAPSWVTFDEATGTIAGTPSNADVGTSTNIVISVTDGVLITSLPAFSIQVTAATTPPPAGTTNRAPVIAGVPGSTVAVGNAYAFQPSASDADGNGLTFSIAGRPSWATFSTSTGRLSGTPTAAATHSNIRISVTDGTATAALPAFSITVQAVANRAPVITGTPLTTVAAGTAYSFQPTASDADGNTLGFSIANRPSWATFSTATGRLSGTPTTSGTHAGIVISVSDGRTSTALPAFTLNVTAAANRAPAITGTPLASATVGNAYTFSPGASDPDGDTLTFSIANRPAWATFNTTTGQLSGTPAATNVGAYSGIVISVSDGRTSTSLAAFSISVAQIGTGSATLTWVAPTQNTDGTALTNLTGYRIHYGTNSSSLTQSVTISNASISTYVLGNLSPGTWYFAVKALAKGVESDFSNVATKTIT